MIKGLWLLLIMLAFPVGANPPIFVYLDGVPVGTMSRFEYQLGESVIWIETNEVVVGCKQDQIFHDRFQH